MAKVTTVDDLNKEDALKTVDPKPDSIVDIGQGIINNAVTGVSTDMASIDKLREDQTKRVEKLDSLSVALGDKSAYAEEQAKIFGTDKEKENFDRYSQELNDINASISGLDRESKAIPLKVQEDFKNVGATDRGVAPVTAGRLRENAIKALTAASLADVITANINNSVIRYTAAKEKADKAVDLKFEPIENEIATLKEQLDLNEKYIIDPKEKKLAAKQLTVLNERERIIKEQKENEKAVSDLFLQAAKNKAPQSVLNKIKKSKNLMEAAGAAGDYLTSPLEKLQLEKLRMDINESRAKITALTTTSPIAAKVDATKSLKGLITELQTAKGKSSAVGFGWQKLIPAFLRGGKNEFISGTEASNYSAIFNQLKDTLAMQNIEKLKGAMSDKDLEFLRNTATKLSLSQSEEAFDLEVGKLDKKMNEILLSNGVDPNSVDVYSGVDNNTLINQAGTALQTSGKSYWEDK